MILGYYEKEDTCGSTFLVTEADFKEILSFPAQLWEFGSDTKLFQSDVILGTTALHNSRMCFSHIMEHGSLKWCSVVVIYGYVAICIFEKSPAIAQAGGWGWRVVSQI